MKWQSLIWVSEIDITTCFILCPAGTNSSSTELYVTGALPSTATFPSPSTLSSYQHTGAYPSRSYATNPSLALPDPAFSTSTNGLFPHHDPLLHLKPSQAVLPTALAFNHLSSSTLGAALPVQSSTYRSAQESAPHLLQPQFSLLPPTLPAAHGATQPYGAAVFSGSIERALQRECSVIKHHQRPSASIAASEQLPSSEQPLHGYFSPGDEVDVSYHQDPSPQSAGAASSSQGACHGPQPKTDSAVCPPASLSDGKACPPELAPLPSAAEEGHSHSLERANGSPERYPSAGQKQNSVIANQQPAQLSSLMTSSVSQSYITPRTQSATSRAAAEQLPPLYKAMTSLSSQPGNVAAATQTLYSSSSGLSHEQELQYSAQAQGLCQGTLSETYSTSHPQGPSNVSFTSQSEGSAPVSQHHSYTAGQPLNQALASSYPTTCVHSQPVAQNYALTQASIVGKPHDVPSQLQTQHQKFVLAAPLPTYTSATQALQNNAKPSYGKQKVEEHTLQEIDAHKQASSADSNGMSAHNNVIFVVSKVDELPKAPSVIRSNSRSDEPFMALAHENVQQFKSERMVPIGQQPFHLGSTNGQESAADMANSNVPLSPGQLKQQHPLQLKSPEPHQHEHQSHGQPRSQASSTNTQFITVPSAQVLLDHNQMILVQHPLGHPGQNSSKAGAAATATQGIQPVQDLGSVHVQYLTMDRELMGHGVGVTQSQQGTMVSEPNSVCADSSKLHTYSQSANQQPENAKNHFSLNSICFPDSMLLTDDRGILSNVDDILAATVAACGVAPQDFVKAASTAEAEMAIMASPVDSKAHFQTVDIRHMSPSFSSAQHPIMSNTNSHSMTLNGIQMAADCHHHGNNGSELEAHGNGGSTEDEYCLAGQASYEPSHLQNRIKGNAKCVKTEDGFAECQGGDDFPKKKVRSKPQTKVMEEDSRQAKVAKRCGPAKRQNAKGGDAGSPTPPPSTYDGCPQQERIRQKIREVEEKQPEVKTGFIGSFLDFIKSGPKHQYSPGPARTFSRQKKPCSSSRPAPLALPTPPPRAQTLAEPPGPQPAPQQHPQQALGVSAQQKRLEEDFQKNLETLPSFSSDEEENTGKNQALRNSISSALSALDESADRKVKTGSNTLGKHFCFYPF